ncbi:MAG: response regulator transcription factor [Anaerolineaceae bacterium]|nr:response regulator transcription factor [Anaerolineaceae bacterium]
MQDTKILIVDDEKNIVDLISAYLKKEEYQVITANDGEAAIEMARQHDPDLIILDIMLPRMDGLEVLSILRAESDAYVIMLTAKTEEIDKIIGLSVGADDYVTKPFSPRELVARIRAALRRIHKIETAPSTESSHHQLAFGKLIIDLDSRKVWMDENELEFTMTEFDLLAELAQNKGRVMSREQLLESVWGYNYFGETRVVDVHVGHVRQKIGSKFIATIRGVGYRFESEL